MPTISTAAPDPELVRKWQTAFAAVAADAVAEALSWQPAQKQQTTDTNAAKSEPAA